MKTEPIHRTSMWKFKLSAATMTLIPAAVGINYVAKALAEGLKLPVWLGSLGTFLASMLAGPVAKWKHCGTRFYLRNRQEYACERGDGDRCGNIAHGTR